MTGIKTTVLAVADEIVRRLKKLPCATAYLVIKKTKKNQWLTSPENLSLKSLVSLRRALGAPKAC